jgi:FixJ family two-component response regulator
MVQDVHAGVDCYQAGAGSVGVDGSEPLAVRCVTSEKQALDSSAKRLVAIIDDDDYARDGMGAYIESLGHISATFATAEEYLSSGVAFRNACLISDVHLPGMQGPDLQVRLLADGHRVPIIFVTGFYDENIRVRVLKAGAIGYLAKPCSESSLIEYLDKALRTILSPF